MQPSSTLVSYLESVVYGRRKGIGASLLRYLLFVLSLLYRITIWVYLLPFRIGLRKERNLSKPVISVGNLTVGGTGKTPVVEYICRGLSSRGWKPAVLSYGYGGVLAGRLGVVSDGDQLKLNALKAGDEPAMLATAMPGVPVVVSRDRFESGTVAIDELGANIMVLDDGFQVWKLRRELDILLMSADNPIDNGRTLPAGKLREPVSAVRRADYVFLMGECDPGALRSAKSKISRITPRAEIYTACVHPGALYRLGESRVGIDSIYGRRVFAFSSIGNPAGFEKTVSGLGSVILGAERFPDHHTYSAHDIKGITRRATELGAEILVTTEKDAIKLEGNQFAVPVVVLRIELSLDDEGCFWESVKNRLGEFQVGS